MSQIISEDSTDVWTENEIKYLGRLKNYCDIISKFLAVLYRKYTIQERVISVPCLILTAANSLASFGIDQFRNIKEYIPLAVGISSGVVSVLTALNSYLEISVNRETCKNGTREINRLSREIVLELSLDIKSRTVSGKTFCRNCFTRLQTIYNTLPIVSILYKNDYAHFSEIPIIEQTIQYESMNISIEESIQEIN